MQVTRTENTSPKDNKKAFYTHFVVKPDRELMEWEKWITIRKEDTENLGMRTERPPIDLVMNTPEMVREDKERKVVLEEAQIKKKPKYKGGLWEQAPRLKQRCRCDNVYEIHRTPAELAQPCIIEHIGIPKYVLENELGLAGETLRVPSKHLNAEYDKYRDYQEAALKKKIVKIDPFRPDCSELIVIGGKPKPPPPPPPDIPDIKETPPDGPHTESLCGVYAMKINNTIILKEIRGQDVSHIAKMRHEDGHEACLSWTYYFNTPINRACRNKLFLENLGTVTIRYCWKKIRISIPYIPEDYSEQVFFFNKNEDVIPPGQKKEIIINFVSDKPGIYSELWEFSTCNIFFFDTLSTKLHMNLYGDSVENIEEQNMLIKDTMNMIQELAMKNTARNIINEAVSDSTVSKPLSYPYKNFFLESEIFLMKNPVCFYHQTEVLSMNEKYTEMVNNTDWDLSISTWREAMMSKDFDDRMNYYDFLKNTHTQLLKPWYEGEDIQSEKYRAVNGFLAQFFDKFYDIRERVTQLHKPGEFDSQEEPKNVIGLSTESQAIAQATFDPKVETIVQNVFYLHIYEELASTIEIVAGVLSSIDLNRWIEFDFCHW